MTLKISVRQTKFELDRGAKYDIALAVENYVTRQRNVVARVGGSSQTTLSDPMPGRVDRTPAGDVLQNGSLMRVFTDPFVDSNDKADQVGLTNEIIFNLPTWGVIRGATPPVGQPSSASAP